MALSNDLISELIKVTTDEVEIKTETTVYGTVVEQNGTTYVKLDGSDLLTPISTTADISDGDRVPVMIKNHTAIVTGNVTSPSAKKESVEEIGNRITEAEILIADKVSTKVFDTEKGRIDELISTTATIKGTLTAHKASIDDLEAGNVTIHETLAANQASINDLNTKKLSATDADLKYATIENLEATNAEVHNLEADYGEFQDLITASLTAHDASIADLKANKLSATDAELRYASIDFANIGEAAIETFFSKSGIIENIVVEGGVVTGELVGVTIKGDLIEGGTVVADKLVVKGTDGLYYKLNTDGVSVESEQTEYNSLNGSVITAKSITATKISVSDLVAFDATIGGFNITDNAIYSGAKESVDNTTRGIYMDSTGQISFGDASNFVKFYKDTDGTYKLDISAKSIKFGASNTNLETVIEDSITSTVEQFYQSTSPTTLSGGSWSTAQPTWAEGTYIWRRTAVTYGDGSSEYTPSSTGVCITGNTGAQGIQGTQGESGIGVTSVVEEYYVSTSKETTTGGSWSTTVPTWSYGLYIWTRSKITYTNGDIAYTTAYCDSSWEAANRVVYKGDTPPTYTPSAGELWLDDGVKPTALRRWLGADVDTIRSFSSTVTNSMVSFDKITGYAQGELEVVSTIEPVQSGSGDPSPDNVRPISGWTGVELTRCGKNLLPPAVEKTIVNNGVTFTSDGQGRYTINGTATGGNAEVAIYLVEPITIGEVAPYCHLLNPVASGSISFSFYRPNGTQITWFTASSVNRIAQIPLLAGETISRINLYLGKDKTANNFVLTPMLCTDDVPASFSPYKGDTYTASFGQTVYGGTLDWSTGILTVTRGQIAAYSGEALPGEWISDRDAYAAGAMPTTGAQVVYELATPITIDLDPENIAALSGVNTLYSNTGDTTVTAALSGWETINGLADIENLEEYIDELEEVVESNTISLSSMQVNQDNISASVESVEKTITTKLNGVISDVSTLSQKVETKMTAEEVTIQIKTAMDEGVDKVRTSTGYTLDSNGLTVEKSDSEMKTQITEDGMTVYKNDNVVLTANNTGVDAVNLHATTYLIIGNNSRFEDWGNRTACFWIGD